MARKDKTPQEAAKEVATPTNTVEGAEDTGTTEAPGLMSALRGRYKETGNCGDDLAAVLAPLSPAGVMELGLKAGLPVEAIEKYRGLNPGQQRMNVSNRLRGLLNKDASLIEAIKQHVAELIADYPKQTKAKAKVAEAEAKAA